MIPFGGYDVMDKLFSAILVNSATTPAKKVETIGVFTARVLGNAGHAALIAAALLQHAKSVLTESDEVLDAIVSNFHRLLTAQPSITEQLLKSDDVLSAAMSLSTGGPEIRREQSAFLCMVAVLTILTPVDRRPLAFAPYFDALSAYTNEYFWNSEVELRLGCAVVVFAGRMQPTHELLRLAIAFLAKCPVAASDIPYQYNVYQSILVSVLKQAWCVRCAVDIRCSSVSPIHVLCPHMQEWKSAT